MSSCRGAGPRSARAEYYNAAMGLGATLTAELNAIHPFREGNGRTSLAFLALLADQDGHPLHLERLEPDVMLRAAIESFFGRNEALVEVLKRLTEGRGEDAPYPDNLPGT